MEAVPAFLDYGYRIRTRKPSSAVNRIATLVPFVGGGLVGVVSDNANQSATDKRVLE